MNTDVPVNISQRLRGYLYLFCLFGTIFVTYLFGKEFIGAEEMILWQGVSVATAGIARFNLGHSPQDAAVDEAAKRV